MTGLPEPHVATHAVGMPAIVALDREAVLLEDAGQVLRRLDSWKPSSPKLNTWSTICCVKSFSASTSASVSLL